MGGQWLTWTVQTLVPNTTVPIACTTQRTTVQNTSKSVASCGQRPGRCYTLASCLPVSRIHVISVIPLCRVNNSSQHTHTALYHSVSRARQPFARPSLQMESSQEANSLACLALLPWVEGLASQTKKLSTKELKSVMSTIPRGALKCTKECNPCAKIFSIFLIICELERWEKNRGKCLGRFEHALADVYVEGGRTVSAVWYVVWTFSSPVLFAAFKPCI